MVGDPTEEVQEQVEAMEIVLIGDHRMIDTTTDDHRTEVDTTIGIMTDVRQMIDDREEGGKLCLEVMEQVPEEWDKEPVEV